MSLIIVPQYFFSSDAKMTVGVPSLSVKSDGAKTKLQVFSGSGILRYGFGKNFSGSDVHIQFFDSLLEPDDGAVPELNLVAFNGANFSTIVPENGVFFSNGCWVLTSDDPYVLDKSVLTVGFNCGKT